MTPEQIKQIAELVKKAEKAGLGAVIEQVKRLTKSNEDMRQEVTGALLELSSVVNHVNSLPHEFDLIKKEILGSVEKMVGKSDVKTIKNIKTLHEVMQKTIEKIQKQLQEVKETKPKEITNTIIEKIQDIPMELSTEQAQEVIEILFEDENMAELIDTINDLPIRPELQIDAAHIKNLKIPNIGHPHGGGVLNKYLSQMEDVSFSSLADKNIMQYSASTGKWANVANLDLSGTLNVSGDNATFGNGSSSPSAIFNKVDSGSINIKFQNAGVDKAAILYDATEDLIIKNEVVDSDVTLRATHGSGTFDLAIDASAQAVAVGTGRVGASNVLMQLGNAATANGIWLDVADGAGVGKYSFGHTNGTTEIAKLEVDANELLTLQNLIQDKDIQIVVNDGGANKTIMYIDSSLQRIGIGDNFTDPSSHLDIRNNNCKVTVNGRNGGTDTLTANIDMVGARANENASFSEINFRNYDSNGAASEYEAVAIKALCGGTDGGKVGIYTTNDTSAPTLKFLVDQHGFEGSNQTLQLTTTTTVSPTTYADVEWDTEVIKHDMYTHSTSTDPEEITIDIDCTLMIDCDFAFDFISGSSRATSAMKLQVDTGSGYADIPNTVDYAYHRTANDGENGLHVSIAYSFSAGDKLKVQVKRNSGSSVITSIADGCRLRLMRI